MPPSRAVHPPASLPAVRAAPRGMAGVTTAKKGVSTWNFAGSGTALARSGASWYCNWSATPVRGSPAGVQFVPMVWGRGSVTAAVLAQARRESHVLLGFNEPDLGSQSNMSVQQALGLWPRLMATRMTLGSPAVASGAATPGGWLDRFMRGAAARGYRVNFIAVHWYGSDFATRAAVNQLESYLRAIHARYHMPIWLTEFALANFSGTPSFPTQARQAAFLTAAASMLQGLPYVQRYAWFALPVSPGSGSTGLFRSGAVPTQVGRAFEAASG
jgi:Glycosyl hydrolase catalytic core